MSERSVGVRRIGYARIGTLEQNAELHDRRPAQCAGMARTQAKLVLR
ncbi:hypothetical protein ACX80I_15685 [Arthrobacter sp. MDT3-44]